MLQLYYRPDVKQGAIWAMEAGCRHIDTASEYATEDMVGEAIKNVTRRGIVKRTELFITSKLPFKVCTYAQVIGALQNSLKRLQLDYLDLYLIHTPRNVLKIKNCDYLEVWKGLEEAKRLGLTRSIGVSNFNSTEINRILTNSKTPPAVNQIETNPTFTNLELVAYCQSKSIVVTGYGSFGFLVPRPLIDLQLPPTFDDPTLVRMAKKHRVEVSQIIQRYLVERYIIPMTASFDKEHIELNLDIFSFTLSPKNVRKINKFNRDIKTYVYDDDGLEEAMVDGHRSLKRFIKANNLRQYRNVV
ncbi:aldo-keto reductase AKR2E4-like [Maniola hyperantus]|uniref:aldo-keto reductase AKR2E4-like n=1 Tax=Aphantopus hyperantus TaxID=2795564 RepID=UPI001568B58B|nr:aldo-keto reductase AKR2E4-like [Maniola hyperantus]